MSRSKIYRLNVQYWSIERIIFFIAGIFVSAFSLLGFFVYPEFHSAALFVGGMLIFFALTGYCPMAILIHRLLKNRE